MRKGRLAVHHRSACSGVKALRNTSLAKAASRQALLPFRSLDPFRALREPNRRRRDEERLSRSEQRTDNNPKNHLTGKAPYKFESISLQRTVRLSQEVTRRGREARLFARVCRPWEVVRSAETGIGRRYGAYRRQCLCWVKFQYRSASDLIQAGRSSCRPAMLRNGLAGQAKPSTLRCSCQVSGSRECASSLSAVRSRGWHPSRMACVMSGAR